MKLITSGESIDFLAKSAPQAWVKRMMLGMITSSELSPFFRSGKVNCASNSQLEVILLTRDGVSSEQILKDLNKYFDPHVADAIRSNKEQFEVLDFSFSSETDAPRQVSSGFFIFADEIDWEAGSLSIELGHDTVKNNPLFWDDELFETSLSNPNYHIELFGMSFDRSAIEMLQPSTELASHSTISVGSRSRLGRPRHWDWDRAAAYLISIAQMPDGLPTGAGAQAKIERLVADWFMLEKGDSPSPSQTRQHVAKLMGALKKPENE